jgi:MHS family proline/betaine transporter-like MFS transporter
LFGGTTPLVTQALITATGDDYWPAWYMMIAAGTPETANRPLWGSGPAVGSEEKAHELLREHDRESQKHP